MEDEDYSWVRRTRFSHSGVRSNSGREQFGAFVEQFNRGAALRQKGSASGFKFHGLNMEPGTRHSATSNPGASSLKGSSSDAKLKQPERDGDRPVLQEGSAKQDPSPRKKTPGNNALVRSSSLTSRSQGPRLKQRARSPFPSRDVPDVFKEAKSSSKRFSTPPPRRRSLSPPGPRGGSPHVAFAPARAPGKLKQRKECIACERAKVAALEVLEKWPVDRSQLLIGHRFASGAQSRLFHGIYMEQPVAVKFIRQPEDEEDAELAAQLEKQFYTEVATLSRLNHPNVIKLVGACSSPPVFCIITEFLSGGSLRSFLHKLDHKSLPLDKIISISLDIAHGMAYIHSQGVVHRDVKPENIIFNEEGCSKIVDFGIACEEAYCDPLANDAGTFRWMAPEMMKHKPYGRKVDVYSFGLIMWEMFSGSVPYEDLNPFQAAFAVFDKKVRPVIPISCPAPMRLLIEQCWASHPEKRPEFSQIVQIFEKFEMVLERDGTLDNIPSSSYEEHHDHKNWLAHWMQKLKHSQPDVSGPPPPKLL